MYTFHSAKSRDSQLQSSIDLHDVSGPRRVTIVHVGA